MCVGAGVCLRVGEMRDRRCYDIGDKLNSSQHIEDIFAYILLLVPHFGGPFTMFPFTMFPYTMLTAPSVFLGLIGPLLK